MTPPRRVRPVGDHALLVECGGTVEATGLLRALTEDAPAGVVDVVAGARTVLVRTLRVPSRDLVADLAHRPADAAHAAHGPVVELSVVYDGPDLAVVAEHLGTDPDGVVRWHSEQEWVAAFLGFAPGFAYLAREGGPADVPRRPEPRTSVPAGAVGVAGPWSAVYPRSSPGGWQLLGRTGHALWDPGREPPALLAAGARVRFRPVRATAPVRGDGAPSPVRDDGDVPDGRRPGAGPPPALEVLDPGPLTLVEDLGRTGSLALGVPTSGAADRASAAAANRLVGNRAGAALLETLGGLRLRVAGDAVVAVTGATVDVAVGRDDDVAGVPHGRPVRVPDGATLEVGRPHDGLRCYVGVRGGLVVPAEVGSRSTDVLSGLGPEPVRAGSRLPVGTDAVEAVAVGAVPPSGDAPEGVATVRVVVGPRADWFADDGAAFLGTTWRVTHESNRVGLRLAGEPLARAVTDELPSEPMVPGAVQVPPSGHPVVLLRDHPTTGGYPVVAVVLEADLDVLARLRPGDAVRFAAVPTGDASGGT